PDLAAPGIRIGFSDRGLAFTQRLHLGPGERDAGLEGFADLIVEARPAIVGDDASLAVRFGGHPPLLPADLGGNVASRHVDVDSEQPSRCQPAPQWLHTELAAMIAGRRGTA